MAGAEHGRGEAHGDFRTKVWSMSGGPYCRPKHWKRNTAIAMAGVFLICIPIAMKSAELELVTAMRFCEYMAPRKTAREAEALKRSRTLTSKAS